MMADLRPFDVIKIIFKYADDVNVLNPQHATTSLEKKFSHIEAWAVVNKMLINRSKTKEIVFRRPNPYLHILPQPIDNIERVNSVKILGVFFSCNLKFDEHVNNLLSKRNQRLYPLRCIKKVRVYVVVICT